MSVEKSFEIEPVLLEMVLMRDAGLNEEGGCQPDLI